MTRHAPPLSGRLALGLLAALLAGLLGRQEIARAFEYRLYDLRVRWAAGRQTPAPELVIVRIDDRSLDHLEPELGQWPWPRSIFAEVIAFCGQARTIVLDVIFPEADHDRPASDAAFVAAVKSHGGVISAVFLDDEVRVPGGDPVPGLLPGLASPPSIRFLTHASVLAPMPPLRGASAGAGFVNYVADSDGVTRASTLLARVATHAMPSLALAGALHFKGLSPADLRLDHRGRLQIGPNRFTLDRQARLPIVPARTAHRAYSIADVLNAARGTARDSDPPLPRAAFLDTMVLIGSTATGLQGDRMVTPLAIYTPGVEVTATAADNLLHHRFYRTAAGPWTLGLILLLAMAPPLFRPEKPWAFAAFCLAMAALYVMFAMGLALWMRVMLPVTSPLLGVGLCGALLGVIHWNGERRHRRELEELERAKQRFTDMLVHDLRTQMAPVVMSLSLLQERLEKRHDPTLVQLANTSRQAAHRLVAQVSSLLDIRRIEEGRMQLRLVTVPFSKLAQQALDEYRPAAEKVGLGLAFKPGADASRLVRVDEEVCGRVLGNLLWNAIKYAEPGSDIELACARSATQQLSVSVANRGAAIPPAQQAELFQPFASISRESRNVGVSASGIGLVFCRLAVESHGGTLCLESPCQPAGDGVRITFTLPAADTPHSPAAILDS